MEECLLDRAARGEQILFLWRSRPAVIIGKNQNPWREANLVWLSETDTALARRCSGGGTVYHDEGNLNYAFIMPRETYEADTLFDTVLSVLAALGITGERSSRTTLAVDGYKVSGNAFCLRRGGALHHGTLLIRSDLSRLHQALDAPPWSFTTRATPSVPATVQNLSAWKPYLAIDDVVSAFHNVCGLDRIERMDEHWEHDTIGPIVDRLASEHWLYDRTPPFTVTLPNGRGPDSSPLLYEVHDGHVTACTNAPAQHGIRFTTEWATAALMEE